jgi:HEAT repeat protein
MHRAPKPIGIVRAARRLPAAGLVAAVLCGAGACEEHNPDLRSAVQLYTTDHREVRSEVKERAFRELARYGRRALPALEASLHVVDPPGRRSVVQALERLEYPETAALLGHLAAFDSDEEVRAAAYRVLVEWAAVPSPRRAPARAALQKADEAR